MIKELSIAEIVPDAGLQARKGLDAERVARYADDMGAGKEFPPIRVCRVSDRESRHFITSGFHRYHAAIKAKRESIACEVFTGTFAEAMWDAAGSNKEWDTVGAQRTTDDRERCVWLAWQSQLTGGGEINQSKISRQTGVPQQTVNYWITHKWKSKSNQIGNTFNETNENVDWAKWTWNPVTGCEHTCVYCYARDIANHYPKAFPKAFRPDFHADRLNAPADTKFPDEARNGDDPIERTTWKNVFVCSMADLFGRWVPDEWIQGVFDSCRRSPQWNYLFLSKFPQRYTDLEFPETSWVGTTVDEQKRVANAEKAFARIDAPVRWLSVEPMLEPIEFTDLKMFDWVVIGGQSRSSGAPEFFPDPFWVNRLIDRAHAAGCKIYCKPNTDPSWHWSHLFREYPDAFFATEG